MRGRGDVLALDIQANLFEDLRTTIIVPLRLTEHYGASMNERVNPRLTIGDETHVMVTTDLTVIQRVQLGDWVANIESRHRDTITAAVDFLLTGF